MFSIHLWQMWFIEHTILLMTADTHGKPVHLWNQSRIWGHTEMNQEVGDKTVRNGRLCGEEDKAGTQESKGDGADGRHWYWQRCWVFPSQNSKKVASSGTYHKHKKVSGGQSRISNRKLIVIGQNPILLWKNNSFVAGSEPMPSLEDRNWVS